MELCSARVGYKGEEGFFPAFSEPLVFGSFVHEMIELIIAEEKALPIIANAEHILDAVLATKFELDPNYTQVAAFELAEKGIIGEAQFAVTEWWKWWEKAHITTPISEHTMYAQLGTLADGRKVWLFGTPDLYSVVELLAKDWKTAGRGWSQGKADHAIQASLYSHLIHHNTGIFISDWEFLVFNRRTGDWESHPTTRTLEQVESAKRVAWMRALQNAYNIYPATPTTTEHFKTKRGWYCSPKFCNAWNICEFKYLADGLDEEREGLVGL
jgi:hypothetical protein